MHSTEKCTPLFLLGRTPESGKHSTASGTHHAPSQPACSGISGVSGGWGGSGVLHMSYSASRDTESGMRYMGYGVWNAFGLRL